MASKFDPTIRGITRRGMLRTGGMVAGAVIVAGGAAIDRLTARTGGPARTGASGGSSAPPVPAAAVERLWSDPATWNGRVPGASDLAVIVDTVRLDVDARVDGVRIAPGGSLVFDPNASRSLETFGNVVVLGRLVMRTGAPGIIHRLTFVNINESRFLGGGEVVLASDVGVWVMDEGMLDIVGAPKLAWTRASGGIAKGATSLGLTEDPVGWQVGDEIVLTPTLPPTEREHALAYDVRTLTSVVGRTITLDRPTAVEHPSVDLAQGEVLGAEVLNLTRNVRIEGTHRGRTHIFVHGDRAQTFRYASLRHMGPRRATGFVPGRYAIHFHLAHGGASGSLMEGIVARECGSHAFVTHNSHGVTWRNCISHDTQAEPYWWDPADKDEDIPALPSDDVLYERCVASLVQPNTTDNFRLSAFFLGAGSRNVARQCVAVGVQGKEETSGYFWPALSEGVWTFEDNISHNNAVHGLFVWQNTDEPHVVTRFKAFHNGASGIFHGAYLNRYQFNGGVLHGNLEAALTIKALSKANVGTLRFTDLLCNGADFSEYVVVIPEHVQPSRGRTVLSGCQFRGYQKAAVGVIGGGQHPHMFDLVDNTYDGNRLWLSPTIPADTVIRVKDALGGSLAYRRVDQAGVLDIVANARVMPVVF